ncbi:MAG TPA: hypothetical protein VIA06_16050 [Candidatus Dormibacteraeota bacterium]|jgi:hypothetical protein|nr:hypothetical protein [Candidatus Dormibacteraeota bacterium]
MEQLEPNPALRDLDALVGDWTVELSNAAFLPDPSATAQIRTSFTWAEEGAILVMRQGDEPPRPASALWLIGRDEAASEYTILYYDARPVSRVYRMTLVDRIWTIRREAPGFWQRFRCELATDSREMSGSWEKSTDDGGTWEHDFDVTYRREA